MPQFKVGDKVLCIYYEACNSPMQPREYDRRIGTIIKLKEKRSGNKRNWCHLVQWEDETDTQCETFLKLLSPLEQLI